MSIKRILVTGGSGFIGTNLIEKLRSNADITIANLDLASPKLKSHLAYWQELDVREGERLINALREFGPEAVIHLAARTDLMGQSVHDYSSNTDGTSRLLEALDAARFTGPAIFTSSMYVCRPGYYPASDMDFDPHTAYGESKVFCEQLVRSANPTYPWIITRPTSIWGPWFGIPYVDFFKIVLAKRYFHIRGSNTLKTYGYVGNTIAQIFSILDQAESVKTRTIYLGDWPPYLISEWADEIAAFVPYRVPRVPRIVFDTLALIGDGLKIAGIHFPMTSFRLRNMTTDNVHDLTPLKELMGGTLPFSRTQGNNLTIEWLKHF